MGAHRRPLEDRFWEKVRIPPDVVSGCWLWTGSGGGWGHGALILGADLTRSRSAKIGAHRLAWEIFNGPIAAGQVVRHVVCDNPPCVNPAHLAVGTQADNIGDRDRKGRTVSGDKHYSRTHPEKLARGERNGGGVKLTDDIVRLIRARHAAGETAAALAREYGVNRQTTLRVVHRQNWKHVP